jgi:ATP-dependent DNA helicase RecG
MLSGNVGTIYGVGKAVKQHLNSAGIETIEDLTEFWPRKYDDYSKINSIVSLTPGKVSIKAKIDNISSRRARRGLHITEADASDETGKVRLVWFNQPYRSSSIKINQEYYLSGEFGFTFSRLQITNPNIEEVDKKMIAHTARILPIYRESKGLNSVLIRKLVANITPLIEQMPETLPSWMIDQFDLMPRAEAFKNIHLPKSVNKLEEAQNRLGFEELFVLMMASKQIKDGSLKTKALPIKFNLKVAKKFVDNLPFKLTDAQRKIIWQIYKDIDNKEPMNRLVEGDVGSGKTVVAAMASLMVAHRGLQVAFIAPTELLATQHSETLAKLLDHSPLSNKIALLTGTVKSPKKTVIKQKLKNNEIGILIGTHALLQEDVDWHRLGLIIIDEQHRFGVEQRQKLLDKAGHMPHILCLTATPIPRSLALTVYGELSISILDEHPSIRAGVDTSIISPNSTINMFDMVRQQLDRGRQAYVVCPLISDSDVLQVASAEKTFASLKQKELKRYRLGLLHGKMKPTDKAEVMQQFINKKIDVLVATTVIEVGVDVPNATNMLIYGADRFGLAQLHQLRGRVGRGEHKGHCFLVMSDSNKPSKRMQAIVNTQDGFKLAELDLEIRGPGTIYGTRQHGLLDLKIAKITDTKLINLAREGVDSFCQRGENLLKYKQIAQKIKRASKLTYLN